MCRIPKMKTQQIGNPTDWKSNFRRGEMVKESFLLKATTKTIRQTSDSVYHFVSYLACSVFVFNSRRLQHVRPDADLNRILEVEPHADDRRGLRNICSGRHVAPHGEARSRGLFLPGQSCDLASPGRALSPAGHVGYKNDLGGFDLGKCVIRVSVE